MANTYRCPICGVEAVIDQEHKVKTLRQKATERRANASFPSHNCELAKGVDHIDFSKLLPV